MTEPPAHVALLRAVNVGGRWVTMAQLREHLDAEGFGPVQTYIQSGNVLVRSGLADRQALQARLRETISQRFGFDVAVMVRRPADLATVAARAARVPEPDGLSEPPRRYVAFLSHAPSAEHAERARSWDAAGEWCHVEGDDAVLLYAVPFHRAKLTGGRLERLLGVTATVRDLKVVTELARRWG